MPTPHQPTNRTSRTGRRANEGIHPSGFLWRRSLSLLEPELDLGAVVLEASSVLHAGRDVISLAGLVGADVVADREDQLTFGDHADVVGPMCVRRDRRACGVCGEEHFASHCLKAVGVEGPV